MLVLAKLSEHKVSASQIHGKWVKCTEKIVNYLFFYSKYQHTCALKQVTYRICNICIQCNSNNAPGCISCTCAISQTWLHNCPHHPVCDQRHCSWVPAVSIAPPTWPVPRFLLGKVLLSFSCTFCWIIILCLHNLLEHMIFQMKDIRARIYQLWPIQHAKLG